MSSKFEKLLNESNGLNDEAKTLIVEAWEQQLSEAKAETEAVLREEFAQKFTHDKNMLIESMDKFLTDHVNAEISDFAEDKQKLIAERVHYKNAIKEHCEQLDNFVLKTVTKEIKELREDKKRLAEGLGSLETFVLEQLTEEIKEFHEDKKALVEQKVKLVKEGKEKISEARSEFIRKAAIIVESNIDKVVKKEITQYKDDIKVARENEFGRQIFEAVASEYLTSYLNEGSEVSKLQKVLESKEAELSSLNSILTEKQSLVESTERKLSATRNKINRDKKIDSLVASLGNEKASVMRDLLESTQTERLEASFEKYLPAVLNEGTARKSETKETLNESVKTEKTGNRVDTMSTQNQSGDLAQQLAEIRTLAGLK